MSRSDRKGRQNQSGVSQPDRLPDDYPHWMKLALAGIIAIGLVGMVAQALTHDVDPDEYEHLHASWLWSQGIKPYEGFFEHHPPLFWYVLRPLVNSFDKANLTSLMVASRIVTASVATGLVAGCWWLFTGLFGRRAAWAGTAFFAMYCGVAPVVVELRPDVPSLTLLVFGTAMLVRGFATVRRSSGGWPTWSLVGGILVGASVCMLTKSVFWTAGLFAALALVSLRREQGQDRREHLKCLSAAIVGMAIPALLQIIWILAASDWATFWHHNVTVNRGLSASGLKNLPLSCALWSGVFRWPMISAPLAFLGLASVFAGRRRTSSVNRTIILFLLASTIVLVLLANGPWPQYSIPLVLLLAGLAGAGWDTASMQLKLSGQAVCLSVLAAATIVWVLIMVILPIPARQGLRQSVEPLQKLLDMSNPGDTYLAMQHWNPVYLMDADPKLFTKLVAVWDKRTIGEFAEAIEATRPRFILGFQMSVWTGQGKYFKVGPESFPSIKDRYYNWDRTGYVLIRRQ